MPDGPSFVLVLSRTIAELCQGWCWLQSASSQKVHSKALRLTFWQLVNCSQHSSLARCCSATINVLSSRPAFCQGQRPAAAAGGARLQMRLVLGITAWAEWRLHHLHCVAGARGHGGGPAKKKLACAGLGPLVCSCGPDAHPAAPASQRSVGTHEHGGPGGLRWAPRLCRGIAHNSLHALRPVGSCMQHPPCPHVLCGTARG